MLQSKAQVIKELNSIDNLIAIYSTLDMVRVEQLVTNKTNLEKVLMSIMSEENDIYLNKIKAANKGLLNKILINSQRA